MVIDVCLQIRRYFDWDHWANRAVLESLATVPVLPAKTLKIMSHILAAEELWLLRLRGEDTQFFEVWPDWSVEECEAHLGRITQEWRGLINGIQEAAELKERVPYTNTKGERYENAMGDILMHVIFHGSHHRGQVAAGVRAAGGEPAYTDFIEAVRKGLVK